MDRVPAATRLDEVAGNRTERTVVNVEVVSGTYVDHSGKRTRQNKLARFNPDIEAGELVGEPGNSISWMIEHRGGNAGFLDHPIAMTERRNPSQIKLHGPYRPASDDQRAGRRIVGDTIQHRALPLRFRVNPVRAAVDNLKTGNDIIRCIQDIENGTVRTLQTLADNEAELALDPRLANLLIGISVPFS